MKARNKNLIATLCSAILALLGFASCEKISGTARDEYGCPTMDYKVMGTVSDEAGEPVKGIRVTFRATESIADDGTPRFITESHLTDGQGRYDIGEQRKQYTWAEQLIVEDVDGEANGGLFVNDTIDLERALYENLGKQYKKGDGWYQGGYEVNVDVTLKKEEKK